MLKCFSYSIQNSSYFSGNCIDYSDSLSPARLPHILYIETPEANLFMAQDCSHLCITMNLAPQESVYFNRKTFFSASQDLATTRSKEFSLPESANQVDLWNLKPPNFTPKLYRSLKIPRRKGRNISLASSRELVVRPVRVSTGVLPEIDQKKALPQFNTSYRPADSFKSKLMFVKTGKYPTGPYKSPKPHDFRPVR